MDEREQPMRENRVKTALKAGKAVSGPIMEEVRTVGVIKYLAMAGHDFLWFDTEHNMLDYDTLLTLVQMSIASDIVPLVRVTDLSYPMVARALDTGAYGVIIPRVDTKEEVEQAVSFAKYPPLGRRGAGGQARTAYLVRDVKTAVEEGNALSMVIVQVESKEAVDRLEEIAAVPGLDVVCIGPQDLSISLGVPGAFDDPLFVETVGRVIAACARHNIPVGMVSREVNSFKRWYEMGIRFLVCGSDGSLLLQAARGDVAVLKSITGQ
jgi:2-dehydro-3-deoxyglucarate aldolase/4-hydroxy-2-oxoheptanedioate aldolase